MRLNIKSKAEPTIQRNLRLPFSFNQQMNATAALADELGVDYHATLLAALEQFNSEFDARLHEMKGEPKNPTNSGINSGITAGINPGRESIPASVLPQSNSFSSTPLTTTVNHKADA